MLSGCASGPPGVLAVNTLSSAEPNTGSFEGLELRARPGGANGAREINIVYFHGIGWTQKDTTLANDFAAGLYRFYGVNPPALPDASTMCPSYEEPQRPDQQQRPRQPTTGGLRIRLDRELVFDTDLSGETLNLTHIGCLDKRVVEANGVRYNIYRFFWDDYFWNGLEYPHVGYDDGGGENDLYLDADETSGALQPEHQRTAALRQSANFELKDNVITYGISDAAMYLGPAGEYIRQGASAALCVAIQDSSEDNFAQLGRTESGLRVITAQDACSRTGGTPGAFAIISESLGSRVVFDVLRDARSTPEDGLLGSLTAQRPELFMLANQIPLIGIGRLAPRNGTTPPASRAHPVMGRIVAMSEVNDLLSYELVPYVEQLWLRTHSDEGTAPHTRAALDAAARQSLIEDFGFEVVDVRARYAGPFRGVISSFADPEQAHTAHSEQPFLMRMMICGYKATGHAEASTCNEPP